MKKKKKPSTPQAVKKAKKSSSLANKSFEDDVPLAALASKSTTNTSSVKDEHLDDLPLSKIVDSKDVKENGTSAVKPSTDSAQTPTNKDVKNPPPLPEGLSDDVLKLIKDLKSYAETCVKGKFFTPPPENGVLLEYVLLSYNIIFYSINFIGFYAKIISECLKR